MENNITLYYNPNHAGVGFPKNDDYYYFVQNMWVLPYVYVVI